MSREQERAEAIVALKERRDRASQETWGDRVAQEEYLDGIDKTIKALEEAQGASNA